MYIIYYIQMYIQSNPPYTHNQTIYVNFVLHNVCLLYGWHALLNSNVLNLVFDIERARIKFPLHAVYFHFHLYLLKTKLSVCTVHMRRARGRNPITFLYKLTHRATNHTLHPTTSLNYIYTYTIYICNIYVSNTLTI